MRADALGVRTTDGRGREVSTSWAALAALGVGAGFVLALLLLSEAGRALLVVDDVGQLLAAGLGSLLCLRAGRAAAPGARAPWLLIGAGVGSWALGQAVWTWFELVLGQEAPFPSPADVGFLLFPLLAAAGLVLWVRRQDSRASSARDVLDGLVIGGSLLLLSWGSALGAVVAEGGTRPLAFALALAYPLGDVVVATVALLALLRTGAGRRDVLLVLAAGMAALAFADSAYVYLVGSGLYASGNLISAGWVTGFLLIAAAAAGAAGVAEPSQPSPGGSTVWLTLPYLAPVPAIALLAWRLRNGEVVSTVEAVFASVLVLLVFSRQFLVLLDNRRLLDRLREREQELAHLAFHDPLTGLANRALFLDRVEQLLAWHHRDGRGLAVMFCDLDDFKDVNDTVGHAAGDTVLAEVADRLRTALRAVDTVARLGGDEFAVLLEQPHDPADVVARRLVTAVGRPLMLGGADVSRSVSIGVACVPPSVGSQLLAGADLTAEQVVALADQAMYRAKAAGKGTSVVVQVGPDDAETGAGGGRTVRGPLRLSDAPVE